MIQTTTEQLLSAALRYADFGYPVFPCAPGGKVPITPRGFKDATTDEQTPANNDQATPDQGQDQQAQNNTGGSQSSGPDWWWFGLLAITLGILWGMFRKRNDKK